MGGAVSQRLNFTFEPDDVDERMCVIENLPRTIVAGEQFAMQIRVRDAFKNGLSGLEPSICLLPKDPAEATAIAKVSGTDLGKGNYVMSSKIYKSFHHFGISIHAGGKIIHSAVIEARPPYPRPACPTARALRHSFAFLRPLPSRILRCPAPPCAVRGPQAAEPLRVLGIRVRFVPQRNG